MPENDAATTDSSSTDTSTGSTAADMDAVTAFLTEHKLTPAQLLDRASNARKWEDRAKSRADYDKVVAERDELRTKGMTADEKAVQAKYDEGLKTGEAQAALRYGSELVRARFEGLIAGRGLDDVRSAALAEHLSAGNYLDDKGQIDLAKLTAYADLVAPKPTDEARTGQQQWGSTANAFGQGQRAAVATAPGAAGLAAFAKRHPKKD